MADRFQSLISLWGDDVSVRWLITLLHFLWQGAVVGAGAAIAGRLLHRASARPRYALYSAALLTLPVCAAVTFCIVDVPASLRSGSHVESPADNSAGSPAMPSQAPAMTEKVPVETAKAAEPPVPVSRVASDAAATKAGGDDNSESPPHSSLAILSRVAPWIAAAYAVGVVCFLLRLLTALWGGHRLRTRTTRVTDAKLLTLIAIQAKRVKLNCVPVVAYCERVAVPTVLGVLRPMVLLPVPLLIGLTPNEFSAILRHEFAHIRRYDLWMNLLQRVIESLLFFHPVVWFISRRLNAEREVCCDDLVVSSGCEPMDYAGALLRMAELCAISRKPGALTLAAAGDRRPQLESRIERLMNWGNTPRLQLTRAGMAGLLMSLASLITVLAIVHNRAEGRAQARTPEVVQQDDPLPSQAAVRVGTARYCYGSRIASMGVSADGKLAVVSCGVAWFSGLNWPAGVFDLTDGRCLYTLPHEAEAVGLSPNGKILATKDDKFIYFWDSTTGKELRALQYMTGAGGGRSGVNWMTFTPDGKGVAVTLLDHAVQLIDVETAKVLRKFSPAGAATACVFSPDGKWMATGGYEVEDGSYFVRLWDVGTGKQVRQIPVVRLPSGNGMDRALAFSPDGTTLAGGGWGDARLHLWDAATGKELTAFPKLAGDVRSVAFAPDGKTVAAAAADSIHFFDRTTGKERLHIEQSACGLAFSQDGSVLTGAVSGAIYRWDAASGRQLTPVAAQDSAVEQIMVSANGRQVFTTDHDGNLYVWDAAGAKAPRRIAGEAGRGIVASRDGRYLAWTVPGVYGGSRIRLYDLVAKRFIDRTTNTGSYIAFLPDGKTLLTVGVWPATVQLWDIESDTQLRSFVAAPPEPVSDPNLFTGAPFDTNRRIALSPDGKMLAIGPDFPEGFNAKNGGAPVRLWDVMTGKPGPKLDKPVKAANESSKAHSPATLTSMVERRWRSERLQSIDGRAFSPDGRLLADWAEHPFGPSQIDHVYVWEAATGRAVATLAAGPQHGAANAAFSPDGRTLATASADGIVRLWDTATWKVRGELRGHRDRITALAFGPDGRLFTGGLDTVVLGWDVQPLRGTALGK